MTKILFFSSFIFLFFINTSFGEASFIPQEKIKDIRVWARETGESYTCVDEYLKRRKQLAIKMGLTPVVLPGSVVVGFVGGAYGGVGLFKLSGLPNGNYADLAALALGAGRLPQSGHQLVFQGAFGAAVAQRGWWLDGV